MNSFAKYPDIATLWSDQNELTADEIRPNHRSGAWTCPTCHNDYIGGGQMIEAQQTGVPVKVSSVRVTYYVRY